MLSSLDRKNKILISMISGGLWIYYRDFNCYELLKRKKMLSVILVVLWIYFYEIEPLFMPMGLILLVLFKKK
jgi:hypothetical protein